MVACKFFTSRNVCGWPVLNGALFNHQFHSTVRRLLHHHPTSSSPLLAHLSLILLTGCLPIRARCVTPIRHVAHKAALSKIKKSGKTRHARVDNATPRVLQYAHIRAEVGRCNAPRLCAA